MHKAMAALRQCTWETVEMWGFDVEQQKTLSRKPYPTRPPATRFSPADYPARMLTSRNQGNVHYRLMISEEGKPTACHIQESTRPKDFDDAVCAAVMKRARFHPALDATGKPVPSYWAQTVAFRL